MASLADDAKSSFYLMQKGKSASVTGPLHEIGWNQQFVLFTDDNWPTRWNVIDVVDHRKFTIAENQRATDGRFSGIKVMSPTDAWTVAKLLRH